MLFNQCLNAMKELMQSHILLVERLSPPSVQLLYIRHHASCCWRRGSQSGSQSGSQPPRQPGSEHSSALTSHSHYSYWSQSSQVGPHLPDLAHAFLPQITHFLPTTALFPPLFSAEWWFSNWDTHLTNCITGAQVFKCIALFHDLSHNWVRLQVA